MDVGPSRIIVRKVLSETLSRVRLLQDLDEHAFAERIQDLPAILREWADKLEDPKDITWEREIPHLGGYSMWADNYDDLEDNPVVAGEEKVLESLIGNTQSLTVLDVGCGTGRHALPLAEKGASVVGYEPVPEMLHKARQKAAALGLDLDLRRGSINDIDTDPGLGTFDLVLCCLVLSHVEDLEDAIKKIGARVAKGGHLIVTDFHPFNILLGFRTMFSKDEERYLVPNFLHMPSDYFQAITRQGMNVTAYEEVGGIPRWPGIPMTLIIMGQNPQY